jgi:hypothetical protein
VSDTETSIITKLAALGYPDIEILTLRDCVAVFILSGHHVPYNARGSDVLSALQALLRQVEGK